MASMVTFRRNHLVRLRGLTTSALNGKLVRIKTNVDEAKLAADLTHIRTYRSRSTGPQTVHRRKRTVHPN